jgi:phosphatidylglycerol:prolipoprotein diacylglycerol transferase
VKKWPHGSMLALFLVFYGIFRFIVEFFREPDAHIGLMAGAISRGQLLSLLMTGGGLVLLWAVSRKQI